MTSIVITQPISDITATSNDANTTINLFNYFDDPFTTGQVATFQLYDTSIGNDGLTNVLLFDQADSGAPLTVQNFLTYVNSGAYTNSIIHRSVPDFIIQGGGFTVEQLQVQSVRANPPVVNEFSSQRSNLQGTIAMAKLGNDPNSATNQWFFNLEDNSGNLDRQNGGFTVFGQVLSDQDYATISAIAEIPLFNGSGINPAFTDLPLNIDPDNPNLEEDNDYIRYESITVSQLPELNFSVSNSRPDLVNATVNNGQLVLDYFSSASGMAEITITATNLLGEATENDTFSVSVVNDNNYGNDDLNSPIYRFQNQTQPGAYLFAGQAESANISQKFPNFQEEGFAFYVGVESGDDLIPMYRFQNDNVPGTYLYAGEAESANIRQNFPNFHEEGLAFYVYGAGSNQGESFYRFQNTSLPGTYIFVGEQERQSILQNNRNFVEEGIAFKALV